MKKSKTFELTKNRQNDNWQLKRRGDENPIATYQNKSDAKKDAPTTTRNWGGDQLIIKGENGRIQEERTYKKDPYPPKG